MKDQNSVSRIQIAPVLTDAQRREVFAFRYEVYVNEMGRRGHIVGDRHEPLLYDVLDETAYIYGAYDNGQLVGTLRGNLVREFTPEAPMPQWLADIYGLQPFLDHRADGVGFSSRLMVAQDRRGSTALGALVRHAYEVAMSRDVEFLFCNCAPSLVGMYERLGFRRYIRNVMDPQVGYRTPMVLVVFDRQHLEAVRSPLLRSLRRESDVDTSSAEWFNRVFGDAVSRHAVGQCGADDFWDQFFRRIAADMENSVQVLQGLSHEQLMRLATSGVVLRCCRGDDILRERDTGSEMFVIVSGQVEVRLADADEVIARLGPGEVVGEIAMLTGATRSACVTALEDSELFVFTRQQLDKLMTRSPDLAARVLLNLSHILSRRLADITHHQGRSLRKTA